LQPVRPGVADYMDRYESIPGWFHAEDFRLFDLLLSSQDPGDLVEIGAFHGASAILMGLHLRPGERFLVCDLFGTPADDDANRVESEHWYGGLTRQTFERNYLSVLPELPTIVQRSSLEILDHVDEATCRFVHLDGSHLYDYVRADLRAARRMLKPEGIVALDDWRMEHTPGVTLAVMEQVVAGELHAIAITRAKFYGVFDEALAAQLRELVTDWARGEAMVDVHDERVRGTSWPRVTAVVPPAPRRTLVRRILSKAKRGLHRALGRSK
jgi:cephalosporin hydroxylase